MKSKIHTYRGAALTVTFDSERCIHAARCVAGLPAVFNPDVRPWVQPDNAAAEAVAEVVRQCPTGALALAEAAQTEAGNRIAVQPDGPLYARGRLSLRTLAGEVLLEGDRMALCRCGASANKPLCDNSHRKSNFRANAALGRLAADGGDGPAGELAITAAPNSPLLLDGPAEIVGAGSAVSVRKAALCRCGLSANKPYCDGSHAAGGFRAE